MASIIRPLPTSPRIVRTPEPGGRGPFRLDMFDGSVDVFWFKQDAKRCFTATSCARPTGREFGDLRDVSGALPGPGPRRRPERRPWAGRTIDVARFRFHDGTRSRHSVSAELGDVRTISPSGDRGRPRGLQRNRRDPARRLGSVDRAGSWNACDRVRVAHGCDERMENPLDEAWRPRMDAADLNQGVSHPEDAQHSFVALLDRRMASCSPGTVTLARGSCSRGNIWTTRVSVSMKYREERGPPCAALHGPTNKCSMSSRTSSKTMRAPGFDRQHHER